MEEKNVIIICVTAIICVAIISGTFLLLNNSDNTAANETVNASNETNNTTTTVTTEKTAESTKNYDPDYDPERDASHQSATEDNPITVQQSDGVYTYYGPGHYDYYAGDNHMSGEYYKEKNSQYQ